MFGGDKTGISQLFVKHCEQTDHHPTMHQHLEKVEAIEVLDCTIFCTCPYIDYIGKLHLSFHDMSHRSRRQAMHIDSLQKIYPAFSEMWAYLFILTHRFTKYNVFVKCQIG